MRLHRVEQALALRTPWVEGQVILWPWPGQWFMMVAAPLDPAMEGRLVTTSRVLSATYLPTDRPHPGIQFRTESGSLYFLGPPGRSEIP